VAKPAVLLSPRFFAALKHLGGADVARVEEALRLLPGCFGRPHVHSGISIRRLRNNFFECRAGLKVRLLFRANVRALEILFVGNPDAVRRVIRDLCEHLNPNQRCLKFGRRGAPPSRWISGGASAASPLNI